MNWTSDKGEHGSRDRRARKELWLEETTVEEHRMMNRGGFVALVDAVSRGVYGNDLAHVDNPEFRAAFDFAAKYAGYHASPSVSPGAWVALRDGNNLKGDYTFLMSRLDDMRLQQLAGPKDQRFGAWARSLDAGSRVRFALNPDFARSLAGKHAIAKVIYLDTGNGTFTIESAGRKFTTPLTGSGVWKTALAHVDSPTLLTIESDTELTLHMVEVTRK